jgi:multiple sugar transport system ATP-binding protein
LRLPMCEAQLPERLVDGLAGRQGSLLAGIRPEHLRETAPGEASAGVAFRACADVVEWMGAETFVHFAVGDSRTATRLGEISGDVPRRDAQREGLPMVARIGGASRAREGDEIELSLDPADLHLFDAASGHRIG